VSSREPSTPLCNLPKDLFDEVEGAEYEKNKDW
jgi:hypothetical protein